MVSTEFVNYQDPMHPCYVEDCETSVNIDDDQYCSKNIEGVVRYRHFWHGVPGITRAAGGMDSIGFIGYAKTFLQAKERAWYYLNNNPYAAPEVKAGEQAVLDEVERLELKE